MSDCMHSRVTINDDHTLSCNACGRRMSRVYWQWNVSIGFPVKATAIASEGKPRILVQGGKLPPMQVPPWNDPRLDSIATDDNEDEHLPEAQS